MVASVAIKLCVMAGILFSCVKTGEVDYEAEEQQKISQYLAAKGYQVQPTESGLYYIVKEEGTGISPENGDTVVLDFVFYNIYGQMIDTSIESLARDFNIFNYNKIYGPVEFVLGYSNEIAGVEEGVSYMKEGGMSVLVVPSKLAFQNYEPYVYDIWLLDIRPGS